MKKVVHIIFICFFCLLFVVAICTSDFRKDIVSEIDNRKLAEFPSITDGGFRGSLEAFIKDRIGGRQELIKWYMIINDTLTNELVHPLYTYGRDGYVFFHMHDNIQFSDYHKAFAEMVLKMQEYCEERGTAFYFIFSPEKLSVYREHLPEGVNYNDEWVDEMFSYMDELGIHYINTTDLLREKSKSEQVFNIKYDAGHWNDLGCFYATNALLEIMKKDNSNIKMLDKEMYDISYETKTTLPSSQFPIKEKVPVFSLKTDYEDVSSEWSKEVELNDSFRHFHYYVNGAEEAKTFPKALVFQGSYYNRESQFLIPVMKEHIGVHNYQNAIDIDYYYTVFQPEVVILDAAEYVLSDKYFDSNAIKRMDLNPALINYERPFESEVEKLRSECEHYPINADLTIQRGEKIDKISVEIKTTDIRYAYLVVDSCVLDLKKEKGKEALYITSCNHALSKPEKGLVVIEANSGEKYYMNVNNCD